MSEQANSPVEVKLQAGQTCYSCSCGKSTNPPFAMVHTKTAARNLWPIPQKKMKPSGSVTASKARPRHFAMAPTTTSNP